MAQCRLRVLLVSLLAALHVTAAAALPLTEDVLESVGLGGQDFAAIFEREGFTSLEDIVALDNDSFTGVLLLKEMGLNVGQRLNVLQLAKTLRAAQQQQQAHPAEAFVLAPKAEIVALLTTAIAETQDTMMAHMEGRMKAMLDRRDEYWRRELQLQREKDSLMAERSKLVDEQQQIPRRAGSSGR